MRLVDLEPGWLEHDGRRVAIIFRCPHCVRNGKQDWWLTCFFEPSGTLPQWLGAGARGDDIVNLCMPDKCWKRDSDDFSTMSVTPSIDASKSGHWHGHITKGAIA